MYAETFYTTQPHIHTVFGDGIAPIEHLLDVADMLNFHNIVITDHDQVNPAILTKNIAARRNNKVRVYVGSEITADYKTHIVAAFPLNDFPENPFPMFQGRRKTVDLIHNKNGVAILAHPRTLPEDSSIFDAIETTTPFTRLHLPGSIIKIGSGDIHFINDPHWQFLTFHPNLDFIEAVRKGETHPATAATHFSRPSLRSYFEQIEKALIEDPVKTGRVKAIFHH